MNIFFFTDNIASVPNVSNTPIGAIVGAIIGVLLLLILGVAIAVVILYLVRCRNTGGNYSTGRRASENKVSIECKPYACMHGITEQQQLTETENCDSKLDMEENMAYGSSTDHDAQISLKSNVAYCKSRKPLDTNMEHNVAYGSSTDAQISLTSNVAYSKSGRQLEENDYENDLAEYDYI
jgi:hypothetical protein